MGNTHDLLNESQFKKKVMKLLSEKGIQTKEVTAKIRKTPTIKQEFFFDISRNHGKPDLIIGSLNGIPCELKSSAELYIQCRYSHAHLISFLLMVIYGQCLGYADLFRPESNDGLSIFLLLTKVVNPNCVGFDDIEGIFRDVLNEDLPLYRKHMGISHIEFNAPEFSVADESGKYGTIGKDFTILSTKIEYDLS